MVSQPHGDPSADPCILLFFGLMSRITNEEERDANTNNSIFIITTSVLNYTNLMCNALSITYQKGGSRGQTDEA